jgi:Flp pilus assembly protein TadG
MRSVKLLGVVLVLAIIGLVAFEIISPLRAQQDARNAAQAVAAAAASKLFTERDSHKDFATLVADAKAAAEVAAGTNRVTLTKFDIDSNEVVHVTVEKEATSLVVKHIPGLRKRDQITESAHAAP